MSVEVNRQERLSGILLHVTSLPSYGGVGDFGPAAYAFADFLHAGKQRLWQVLPLSPTGYGSSPYSALSAFAGNPLLISLELLANEGWIARDRIAGLPGHEGAVDFGEVFRLKLPLIEEAAANFLDRATSAQRARFQKFCNDNTAWLPDYAMFNVLRRDFDYKSWNEWPAEFAQHRSDALTILLNQRGRELAIWNRSFSSSSTVSGAPCAAIAAARISACWAMSQSSSTTTARRLDAPRDLRARREPPAHPRLRGAARLLLRDRPALGQSALQVGSAAGAGLRLVAGPHPPFALAL